MPSQLKAVINMVIFLILAGLITAELWTLIKFLFHLS